MGAATVGTKIMTTMTDPPTHSPAARSPWERFGWLMGAIWLVFLAFPVTAVATASIAPALQFVALLAMTVFAAGYLIGFWYVAHLSDSARAIRAGGLFLAGLCALSLIVAATAGIAALGMMPFLIAFGMFNQRLRTGTILALFWIALTAAVLTVIGGFRQYWFFLIINALVMFANFLVRWIDTRQDSHLVLERQFNLIAERERVARDVHDVLGHSLTVLTVKTQLARRLIDSDPEAAKDELTRMQAMTREALGEIRATVSGLRVARLSEELDNARQALSDVGIDASLPDNADIAEPRYRLAMAWLLREAVTNVVRHSNAQHCRVGLTERALIVTDDGVGAGDAGNAHGLRGADERVRGAGGELIVTGSAGAGTRVEARW